ncbi:HipA domain-containing protein [Corynebacterium camporealensis]|uniref:HipA domain-containing protein n=1 Tax=Corynebacterium camporealensis TaxID=161896 RepID=UPI0034D019F1
MVDVRAGKGNYAELIDDDAEFDRQALAGVQEKASARTIALPIKGNAILKLSPKEFPGLVENEATCLAAYRTMPSARGKVVRSAVVEDSNRVSGLVLERFDGSFPHKHAVEDASQLLGIYPGAKYDVSYEQLCEAVLNVVASPLMAARGLAQQLAFAWLSGNGDLHAKNISVMDAGRGFELTPVTTSPALFLMGATHWHFRSKARQKD